LSQNKAEGLFLGYSRDAFQTTKLIYRGVRMMDLKGCRKNGSYLPAGTEGNNNCLVSRFLCRDSDPETPEY
jgi:hypothetical protein